MAKVPKPLNDQELLARFIDSEHLQKAHERFPDSPWKFYCEPYGQYSSQGWINFQKAYRRAWDYASSPRRSFENRVLENKLTLDLIIQLNSLFLFGELRSQAEVVRHFYPVFRELRSSRMKNLFSNRGVAYKNPDSLEIRVEGFLTSRNCCFIASLICEKISEAKTIEERKKWCRKLKSELHPELPLNGKRNFVFFLLDPKQIVEQLHSVLKFYEKECQRILQTPYYESKNFNRSVGILALKMQRYIDMTHLAIDATSRTSRLIEEFIYWQFGLNSPKPNPISYAGIQWHRSAYLPFNRALKKLT